MRNGLGTQKRPEAVTDHRQPITDQPCQSTNSTVTGLVIRPALDAALEEESDGLAAALAVVERPVVDVHPDEGVGLRAVEAAGVLHRVVERTDAVLQSIRDAVAKMSRNLLRQLRRRDPSARRCRPAAGAGRSPRTTTRPGPATRWSPRSAKVSWPSWMRRPMSTSPCTTASSICVERRDHRVEVGLVELQREVGAGERTRDRDALALDARTGRPARARRAAVRSDRPSRHRAGAARTGRSGRRRRGSRRR